MDINDWTPAQIEAVTRLYNRGALWVNKYDKDSVTTSRQDLHSEPLTLDEFRARFVPAYDCIMVKWCGMWVGIEKDGYTHT